MISRLFQIVYKLMDCPQMTAKELAAEVGVSERTIYRDVEKLSLAGIPIYANQGKNGGIALLPDFYKEGINCYLMMKRKRFWNL